MSPAPSTRTKLTQVQKPAPRFPQRFEFVAGDSTLTVPQYAATHPNTKCDLLSVDGGHSLEVLKSFSNLDENPVTEIAICFFLTVPFAKFRLLKSAAS